MLVVIFSCWCSSFCCCSSIAFRHHPSPICVLSPEFLHPILYFEPTTSQSDSRHFHLLNRFVLATSATTLSGHFLPTGIFYLTLFPNIFGTTCFYQGLPGSRQFFLEVCKVSYWFSKHRPSPSVCLIHSNPQPFIYLKFVFMHVNVAKVFTCGENFDKKYRSATTLCSSDENIKQQPN